MVTQFTPVQPGWAVRFKVPSTDAADPAPYTITLDLLGWVTVTDTDGWEADAVVWYGGQVSDAEYVAEQLQSDGGQAVGYDVFAVADV